MRLQGRCWWWISRSWQLVCNHNSEQKKQVIVESFVGQGKVLCVCSATQKFSHFVFLSMNEWHHQHLIINVCLKYLLHQKFKFQFDTIGSQNNKRPFHEIMQTLFVGLFSLAAGGVFNGTSPWCSAMSTILYGFFSAFSLLTCTSKANKL